MKASRALTVGTAVALAASGCSLPGVFVPSREAVLKRILPSTVQIVVEQREGRRVRTASGVALASRRAGAHSGCFILTSGHTVSGITGHKEVFVFFGQDQGAMTKTRATVLSYRDTPEVDLALLQTDGDHCVPARAGQPPRLGESVWVVGFPWGRHMTLASGIVSQVNADQGDRETRARLMVDAPVSYGSSGGGVFDASHGALIGVVEGYNTARVSSHGASPAWYIDVPVPGQTFVTPMSDVKRFLAGTGHADLMDSPSRLSKLEQLARHPISGLSD